MYVAASLSSLWNYHREGISRDGVLKRYALIYENIIFNHRGIGIGKGQLAETLGECISMLVHKADSLHERKSLGKNKEFCKIFIDCWDFVEDAGKFESQVHSVIQENGYSRIGDFCHNEIRRINGLSSESYEYDIDDVKELYSDISADIGINQLLLNNSIDLIPSYSPIIGRAISNEFHLHGIECYDMFDDGILVPDFESLSWDEIIELRNDNNIKNFRKMIRDLSEGDKNMNDALVAKVQKDLWELIAELKPNTLKSFLSGFLGNLPSPTILNPIGVGAAINDTYKSHKTLKNYGHLYFIQNIRSKVS